MAARPPGPEKAKSAIQRVLDGYEINIFGGGHTADRFISEKEIPQALEYGHGVFNASQTFKVLSVLFLNAMSAAEQHSISPLVNIVIPGGRIGERSLAESGDISNVPLLATTTCRVFDLLQQSKLAEPTTQEYLVFRRKLFSVPIDTQAKVSAFLYTILCYALRGVLKNQKNLQANYQSARESIRKVSGCAFDVPQLAVNTIITEMAGCSLALRELTTFYTMALATKANQSTLLYKIAEFAISKHLSYSNASILRYLEQAAKVSGLSESEFLSDVSYPGLKTTYRRLNALQKLLQNKVLLPYIPYSHIFNEDYNVCLSIQRNPAMADLLRSVIARGTGNKEVLAMKCPPISPSVSQLNTAIAEELFKRKPTTE